VIQKVCNFLAPCDLREKYVGALKASGSLQVNPVGDMPAISMGCTASAPRRRDA